MKTLPWGFGPRWFRKRRQARALDSMGEQVMKGLELVFPELRKIRDDRRQS